MKHFIITFLLFILGLPNHIMARNIYSNSEVVKAYGIELSNWATDKDTYTAMQSFDNLIVTKPGSSDASILLSDDFTRYLVNKYNYPKYNTYRWATFVSCMEKEIESGVKISLNNIQYVPESMVSQKRPGVQYYSCKINVSGSSNVSEDALFYVKDGKILKIDAYEVIRDKNGKSRVKVDFSGLDIDEDTEGMGISYNYSKAFPVGGSIYYSKWKFMISLDFGKNFDKDIYTTQKVDFTNIVDYKITKGEYDLKYFITATPAFYMKYFSVGCGFGCAFFNATEYIKEIHMELDSNGNGVHTSANSSTVTTSGNGKSKLMIRPAVKGYIPCSDYFFISLAVNYDWILGYKDKNGISFGAGIHFLFD